MKYAILCLMLALGLAACAPGSPPERAAFPAAGPYFGPGPYDGPEMYRGSPVD